MQRPRTTELSVSRTIAAGAAAIYDTWLDAKAPGSPWFGTARAIVNPTVEGLFYHAVHFEGHDWAHYGRFLALERPRRIQHTWVSEATRGLESIVTLILEAKGKETLARIHHTNLPDDEMGRRHSEGWGFVLGAIAERFAKASPQT